eukprot:4047254-Amphidinium_carterae.1
MEQTRDRSTACFCGMEMLPYLGLKVHKRNIVNDRMRNEFAQKTTMSRTQLNREQTLQNHS